MDEYVKQFAGMLDGREYLNEITRGECREAKEKGVVVVYGYSDDNVELDGAIYDEVGAYEGTVIHLNGRGIIQNECDNKFCPYHKREAKEARIIKAIWCPDDRLSWAFETDIPHETFLVVEDGEPFCQGIVFSINDL